MTIICFTEKAQSQIREDWIYILELEPCIRQTNKGYGYERDKRYFSEVAIFQNS